MSLENKLPKKPKRWKLYAGAAVALLGLATVSIGTAWEEAKNGNLYVAYAGLVAAVGGVVTVTRHVYLDDMYELKHAEVEYKSIKNAVL